MVNMRFRIKVPCNYACIFYNNMLYKVKLGLINLLCVLLLLSFILLLAYEVQIISYREKPVFILLIGHLFGTVPRGCLKVKYLVVQTDLEKFCNHVLNTIELSCTLMVVAD